MIQKNISLKNKNTLGIDSTAEFFCEVKTKEDLQEAFDFIQKQKCNFRILGLGSNIILPSEGLKGLTIFIKYQRLDIQNGTVILGAANLLSALIMQLAQQGYDLSGLAGYPSTLGGSVRGNAGLLGVSTGDFLKTATLFNIQTGEWIEWSNEDFHFDYRHSEMKNQPELLFWEGEFEIPQGERSEVVDKVKTLLVERGAKQPSGKCSGSFFKNPTTHPNNPEKFAAGYLIDQCGLKGTHIGGAIISQKHANFFMNTGDATSQDFVALIDLAKTKVKEKFDIDLELEVELVQS